MGIKYSGFILFPILIYIQLYSWLVVSLLEKNWILIQQLQSEQSAAEAQQILRKVLHQVESKLDSEACLFPYSKIHLSCKIEFLQEDSCKAARYYRITVGMKSRSNYQQLQSIFAVPAVSNVCDDHPKTVSLGRKALIEI